MATMKDDPNAVFGAPVHIPGTAVHDPDDLKALKERQKEKVAETNVPNSNDGLLDTRSPEANRRGRDNIVDAHVPPTRAAIENDELDTATAVGKNTDRVPAEDGEQE